MKLGLNAKLYVGAAGSTASTLVGGVKDVTLTLESAEADDSTRDGGGWRSTAATLRSATVEFELRWNPSAAGFATIRAAFLAGTAIALFPKDEVGGTGLDADFVITNFSRNEPLEGIETVNVTAKLNTYTRTPTWT